MQVELKQIVVPPGQQLLMTDVSWLMYEQMLEEFGEKRNSRINYSGGVLEIMVPLPEHEDDRVIIADLVKVLLEELNIEFRNLGSTTFKSETMKQGIEADDCFYIENETAIRGKKRIDLAVDPPPDLALEIDITSRTRFDNYEVLGVKELWLFNGKQLEINVLQSGRYIQENESLHFPGFRLRDIIPQYLERSKIEGRNKIMKEFRAWVSIIIQDQ
ncbi:Uma2 family endonuclease [Aetokthonos hydrillicola Thurmond2011]|jgi:Uma2 family endonuclease|uniref:Uma2 family endonuclease n=1 Tax=Aetokthonos hydrillicola Thurmond2011 TaxID=2712845 RepID=A0AAP5M5S3_9CYAN|nr:Uma2 family endonuclease [Aetokthonos hydrillicola]MBO3462184.1 Uma2 family endonuclease [Aetokthonos hydrillicola CCALA 1050]MBW4588568.1 Uma2 family endonuclease [Aetokthonos hydrillicola CCALA 1050]MDR9896241.1 Uma2 family endonuclease [Aetokthonos hydrillicola Thurmond2011]